MSTAAPFVRPELLSGDQPLSTWHFLVWLWRRPTWGPAAIIVGTLLTAWGMKSLFFPASGGQDLYWYLSSGKLIAESGGIAAPLRDPFAYTTQAPYDAPRWLNHEWLFTWMVYTTHHLFGLAGLVLMKYKLLFFWGLSFVWMGHRLCRDWVLGLLTAMITIPLLGDFCDLRPQLITYMLTTLLLATWLKAPSRPWLALGVWLLLLIFWANCHSAVILGIALLLGCLILHGVTGALDWRVVFPALVLVAVAPLANPYTVEVYLYPISWIGNTALTSVIQEWQPMSASDAFSPPEWVWILWPLGTLLVLSYLGAREAFRWNPLYLLPLGVYLMPLQASRHLPLAHIAFAAWWMLAIARATPWIRLEEREEAPALIRPGSRSFVEVLALVLLLAVIPAQRWVALPTSLPQRTIDHLHPAYQFPTGAWAFIEQYQLVGNILNFYDWGGWLTWQLAHESPRTHAITIDGRLNTVYSAEVIDAYGALVQAQPASLTKRAGWDVVGAPADLALLPTLLEGQPVDITSAFRGHPDWALVYEDPVACVFVRRDQVTAKFIEEAQGLRLAVPEDPQSHYGRAMQVLGYGDVEGAKRELTAALALDPQYEAARDQLELLESIVHASAAP